MSTNSRVAAQPLGLVLPNFARNKTATGQNPVIMPLTLPRIPSRVIPPVTPPVTLVLSQPVTPLILPRIASPKVAPITPPVTLVLSQHATPLNPSAPVPLILPRIASPKVIQPRSPQVATPLTSLSPIRSAHNTVLQTPQLQMPRLRTPGRIAITDAPPIVNNPWLPAKSTADPIMIKLTAMTPIGTIAMVPTADKRPPPTPRRLPAQPPTPGQTVNRVTLKVAQESDPLINATIYLDLDKTNSYNHVSDHMRSISAVTNNLHKHYATQYKPLPNVQGRVAAIYFEELLSIYENNQVFYQDRLDDNTMELAVIKSGLTELEYWFMRIIEPQAADDVTAWREREQLKLTKGYSAYCDPELYKHIVPAPVTVRNEIQVLQGR